LVIYKYVVLKFNIPLKLCDDCYLLTYSTKSENSDKTLYYCQNPFCIKFGKNIESG